MKLEATIVYEDIRDKELLNLIDSKVPIFIEYIDFNTVNGRKESYRVKSLWAAKKNPFIVVVDKDNNDKVVKVFYSDGKGNNAVQQFINYLNNESKNYIQWLKSQLYSYKLWEYKLINRCRCNIQLYRIRTRKTKHFPNRNKRRNSNTYS